MGEHVAFYLLKRASLLAVVLFLGASLIFGAFFVLPGDPVRLFVPKGANVELSQQIVDDLRLDEPLIVQYANFMAKVFTGDFPASISYRPGVDIESFIYPSLASTLGLYLQVLVIGCLLGAFLDQVISRLRNKYTRTVGLGIALVMFAAPIGGTGILLLYLIATYDLPFPLRGGIVIPVLAGVIATSAGYVLIAARSISERPPEKGGIVAGALKRALSMFSKPDRKATLMIISAWIMTIVLVTEVVFSRDGLGLKLYDAMYTQDYPLAMSVAFLVIVLMAVIQFTMDVSGTLAARKMKGGSHVAGRPQGHLDADSAEQGPLEGVPEQVAPETGLLKSMMITLTSTWRGRIAAGVLLVIIVVGMAAPWLSTVGDPMSYSSLEPVVWEADWINPLPPSFERSQYTGFMHPLGTDSMGRDVYSVMLHGLGDELVVAAVMVGIALLVGMIISILAFAVRGEPGFPSLFIRACASAFSWTFLAIPLFGGLIVVTMATSWETALLWDIPALALIMALSWASHALYALEKSGQLSAGPRRHGLVEDLKANTHGILHVGKIVFLVTYLSVAALAFVGLTDPDELYWGSILESAFNWGAFSSGAWWWLVPPILATIVLSGTVYAILDMMEKTAEKRGHS